MAKRILLAISLILGVIAALLGAFHGYGEVLQGNAFPKEVVINAFGGSDCIPEGPRNCFPAMTIVPASFMVSGILSLIIAVVVLISTIMIVTGKWRGIPLLVSSVILLLVGGGFLPPILGVVGALVGHRATRKTPAPTSV